LTGIAKRDCGSGVRRACVRLRISITNETLKIAPALFRTCSSCGVARHGEKIMKTTISMLFAAGLLLSSVPAHAVVLDLSTLSCKQFLEGGDDEIKMVLTWMDGWYKGDEDTAIIDTNVFVENAKKFGAYCAANPTISIVNAAEEILGK
jgi:acid stress chaperone HdeB